MAHASDVAKGLGTEQTPMSPPAPPNITRGARTDPRGTGTGMGADNISGTSLSSTGAA